MAPTPGLLFVTMQPKDDLDLAEFHDWYNNEHGPTRLRLPFIQNGYRYRSMHKQPDWLALYDITDMQELTRETYTSLRLPENKTDREKDVMGRIDIVRSLFDLRQTHQSPGFKDMDSIENIGKNNILVASTWILKPDTGTEEELSNWFNQEHCPLLSKVPGWRRSRWFKTSSIASDEPTVYLGIHEFEHDRGMVPETMKGITSTPWAIKIGESCATIKSRRSYNLSYTFGPAPRELSVTARFTTRDNLTRTLPPNVIESYITTKDGVSIPYRLEGAQPDSSPVILLSNCILTDCTIWDAFLKEILPKNTQYRILRYNTRGRSNLSASSTTPITLTTLSEDIITLFDALRIPRAILIGVSLGGATVLNTALTHPSRTKAFIACDTNAVAPATNRKAWIDRISMAENEAKEETSSSPDIVGKTLAAATVDRWFANHSHEEHGRISELVRTNSLSGFKGVVHALFEYDMRSELQSASAASTSPHIPGLFLVGADDGVLPKTMRDMADSYGSDHGDENGVGGRNFVQIENAGHLPMVEQPMAFAEAVQTFLDGLQW